MQNDFPENPYFVSYGLHGIAMGPHGFGSFWWAGYIYPERRMQFNVLRSTLQRILFL